MAEQAHNQFSAPWCRPIRVYVVVVMILAPVEVPAHVEVHVANGTPLVEVYVKEAHVSTE